MPRTITLNNTNGKIKFSCIERTQSDLLINIYVDIGAKIKNTSNIGISF